MCDEAHASAERSSRSGRSRPAPTARVPTVSPRDRSRALRRATLLRSRSLRTRTSALDTDRAALSVSRPPDRRGFRTASTHRRPRHGRRRPTTAWRGADCDLRVAPFDDRRSRRPDSGRSAYESPPDPRRFPRSSRPERQSLRRPPPSPRGLPPPVIRGAALVTTSASIVARIAAPATTRASLVTPKVRNPHPESRDPRPLRGDARTRRRDRLDLRLATQSLRLATRSERRSRHASRLNPHSDRRCPRRSRPYRTVSRLEAPSRHRADSIREPSPGRGGRVLRHGGAGDATSWGASYALHDAGM